MAQNATPHEKSPNIDMIHHASLRSLGTMLPGPIEASSMVFLPASPHNSPATVTLSAKRPVPKLRIAVINWGQELASIAFSLCLWLPIIIGILHVYDGRPLADWPLPVTLNALIAFISTACRTAFIFSLVQVLAQQRWDWYESPRSLGDFSVFIRLREEYGEV